MNIVQLRGANTPKPSRAIENGTGLAVLKNTRKMSSQDTSGAAFPIACERCGRHTAMPIADGTIVSTNRVQIGVRCGECHHTWFVLEPNASFKLRRKDDRRKARRDS
jgi:hypothetical protein